MSSPEPITFVDLADAMATTPVAVGLPSGSALRVSPMALPVVRKDTAGGTGAGELVFGGQAKRIPTGLKNIEVSWSQDTKWNFEGATKSAQMDQLAQTQAEVRDLARKVDLLAVSIEALHRPGLTTESDSQPTVISPELIDVAVASGRLADLLDLIADEQVRGPGNLVELAEGSLTADDPKLRAAAARALSFLDPAKAKIALPKAIDAEANRFTMAVLRGALRAAT